MDELLPVNQMQEIEGQMAGGGDRGMRAQMLAEELAQDEYGKEFYDLTPQQQFKIYTIALDMIDTRGMASGGRIGFSEGGKDLSNDPNYQGWKKIYETNPDAAAMNEKQKQDNYHQSLLRRHRKHF